MNKKILLNVLKYVWLLAFSVVYMLIFSLWTTPLYKGWYGCDASFFTMAGRGITKGWVPYIDFFDLKGPYFFFIEALGQLIVNGRTGAFILQCVALFISLILILRILNKFDGYLSIKMRIFIVGLFLFFHIATLWGGNTLEEFMLPLNLLSLYMILPTCYKYRKKDGDADINMDVTENIRPLSGFLTGVCFGIIMFSKITVASPIAGIVIAVIITCLKRKDYKKLIIFLINAVCGILVAVTPLFIYFGLHNAILRMLYCVFIFAFKRSVDFGQKFNLRWELKISGCYFAMIFVLFQVLPIKRKKRNTDTTNTENIEVLNKDNKTSDVDTNYDSEKPEKPYFLLLLTFCMAFVTAVLLHFGDPFIYYFTTVYPTLIIAFITMFIIYRPFTLFKDIRIDIPVLCFLVVLCYFASHSASTLNTVIYDRGNGYYMDYVKNAEEMGSLIPTRDRDNVYSINMDMQWFEINKILPCYTYTINLQFFVSLDNRIEQEIIEMLGTRPPKWIVVGPDLASYLPNLNDVVLKNYIDIYDNDYGSLYLLNGETR